jgi:hypothetical protein
MPENEEAGLRVGSCALIAITGVRSWLRVGSSALIAINSVITDAI